MEQVFHLRWVQKRNPAGGGMFPLILSTSPCSQLILSTSTVLRGRRKTVIAEMTAGVPLSSHAEIVFPGPKLFCVPGVA